MQIKLGTAAIATVLAVTGFVGLRAAEALHEGANPPADVRVTQRSEAAAAHGYSAVVKKVVPAVVNISSTKIVKAQAGDDGSANDLFRQFFGDQVPAAATAAASSTVRPGDSKSRSRTSGRRDSVPG